MTDCQHCGQGAIAKDVNGPVCPDCIDDGWYDDGKDDEPDCKCDSADAVKTLSTSIEELEGPCAKPGITKGGPRLMEQHEILDDYIGDCPCYTPNGDGIMEADIDGEWVRMADVEANILRKVNAHKSEEEK